MKIYAMIFIFFRKNSLKILKLNVDIYMALCYFKAPL